MDDSHWEPDPVYAEYPTHVLHDVPLAVLEAGRAVMLQAAEYRDVDPEDAQPLADSVIAAAVPVIREWLGAVERRDGAK